MDYLNEFDGSSGHVSWVKNWNKDVVVDEVYF